MLVIEPKFEKDGRKSSNEPKNKIRDTAVIKNKATRDLAYKIQTFVE